MSVTTHSYIKETRKQKVIFLVFKEKCIISRKLVFIKITRTNATCQTLTSRIWSLLSCRCFLDRTKELCESIRWLLLFSTLVCFREGFVWRRFALICKEVIRKTRILMAGVTQHCHHEYTNLDCPWQEVPHARLLQLDVTGRATSKDVSEHNTNLSEGTIYSFDFSKN